VGLLLPAARTGSEASAQDRARALAEAIVDREPEPFIRGLLHSDGCRVMNRVAVDGKDYAYPRYFFSQVSKDIQALFCRSLARLEIDYTIASRGKTVSVARAAGVARLDYFVGPKS
jgi:hypothetical protein